MKLFVVEKKVFNAKHPKVKAEDIGLVERTIVGKEVYTFSWDPDVGRDDSLGGKQRLAQTHTHLKHLLHTVREEGDNGYLISNSVIYREVDVVEDIRRLERDPELDYSQLCLNAHVWVMAKAELHNL